MPPAGRGRRARGPRTTRRSAARVAEEVADVPAHESHAAWSRRRARSVGTLSPRRAAGLGGSRRARSAAPTRPASGPRAARHDPRLRPVAATGQGPAEGLAGRPEQQLAGVGDAAADDEEPGSSAAARFARPTPSQRPTSPNSSTAQGSPSRAAAVTTGPASASTSPPTRSSSADRDRRPGPRQLAGLAAEHVARRVLLQAAAVAALAPAAVGHDDHVPELAGHAEAAALQRRRRARSRRRCRCRAYAHEVGLAAAGAEAPLGPGRGVGVVLDHHRQAAAPRSSASRSGSSRQARCGENRTRDRGRRRRIRRRRCPTAATSCAAASSRDDLDDGGLDRAALRCDGVRRSARASTRPAASTTPAATLVPPMSTPTARVTARAGEVGGADEAGVVAQRGPGDLQVRPVRAAGQRRRRRPRGPGRAAGRRPR